MESTQGKTKNKPGPLAPPRTINHFKWFFVFSFILPERMRPRRIITARSYSCTTYD